ncbi:LysE/ArgO family amino acid transporter [Salirhabdus salicampi]|uniref:LysE/ArgO family amino acid transporter n=1 Tax=Salirhabdus salicampi TaxID=476102 RepID=UPI0020C4FC8B|nr:LysE family transporter [Salirhabdus salicampi]
MTALLHGIILAFGLILPLGVQNVFIFNQGATQKYITKALPAIITAAICDTVLILLAVTGVSLVVLNFEWIKQIIFIVGFFFLMYMGWSILKSNHSLEHESFGVHFPAKRQIGFAASVSLLNPHAIIDIIGVIGPNSLAYKGMELTVFTLACIFVSWIWFFGLAIVGRLLGKVDTTGKLVKRFNIVSAFIIWGMAIYIGFQVF